MARPLLPYIIVLLPWTLFAQQPVSSLSATSSQTPSVIGQAVSLSIATSNINASSGAIHFGFGDSVAPPVRFNLTNSRATILLPVLPAGDTLITVSVTDTFTKTAYSATLHQVVTTNGSSSYSPVAVPTSGAARSIALLPSPPGTTTYAIAAGSTLIVDQLAIAGHIAGGLYPQTFQIPAIQVITADVNGDGLTDIIALDSSTGFRILRGNADGTFQAPIFIPATTTPTDIAVGDFNNDGYPDFAIIDNQHSTLSVIVNFGNGSFSAVAGFNDPGGPVRVKVADINGDGFPDILTANSANDKVTVYFGSSTGSFGFGGQISPGSSLGLSDLVIADLNGDGKPDLITANSSANHVSVLLGNGDGSFQAPRMFATDLNPVGLTVTDLNGDQKLDIVTANRLAGTISILYGNGDGTFQAPISRAASASSSTVTPVSLNNSGRVDLLIAGAGLLELQSLPSSACSYAVGPASSEFSGAAGSGVVNVATTSDCLWSSTSNVPWLTITAATTQTGSGAVFYNIQANPNLAPRFGTLTIAGQTFSVLQAGANCAATFSPISGAFGASGGSGSVAVAIASVCPWTATPSVPWISITSGGSGTGNGTINYTVAPIGVSNFGRAGAININATSQSSFNVTQAASGLEFYTLSPCRIIDTRPLAVFPGSLGAPRMGAGQSRTFPVLSSACGIPSNAAAYSLNFTAVPVGFLGVLTTWPTGQARPNASTLNSYNGTVVANAAIVPAGTNGAIDVFVSDPTDVVVDVNGYFAPPQAAGLQFFPLSPCRVADTRLSGFPPNLGAPTMAAGQTRSFPVPSSTCGVPANASAYSFNFTVVPAGFLGVLTTWPTGLARPNASTLNSYTGTVVANAAIVPAGTSGAINVYTSDKTDVLFDINGYFATPAAGGLNFYTVPPCRVADTRLTAGFTGSLGAPSLASGETRIFPISASACGIPSNASAYSLNVTAVPAGFLGLLTAWPTGQSQPNASTLNSYLGTVVANAAIVPAGNNGAISIYVSDASNVILDINGYFAP